MSRVQGQVRGLEGEGGGCKWEVWKGKVELGGERCTCKLKVHVQAQGARSELLQEMSDTLIELVNSPSVGEGGSTLDPQTNHQPTNQQTTLGVWLEDAQVPVCYLSVHITIAHELWDDVCKSVFDDADWYICYPHTWVLVWSRAL